MLCRVEELSGSPTDIEWAYAEDRLHVLQARPITTHVPLPPEMATRPGERRRLYARRRTLAGPRHQRADLAARPLLDRRRVVPQRVEETRRNRRLYAGRGARVLGGQPILHERLQHHVDRSDPQTDGKKRRHDRRAAGRGPGCHRSEAIPRGDAADRGCKLDLLVFIPKALWACARHDLERPPEHPHPSAGTPRVPAKSRRLRGRGVQEPRLRPSS